MWVFGAAERLKTDDNSGSYTGKVCMFTVPDRGEDTLLAIIEQYIRKGSIIYSDCGKSYSKLGIIDLFRSNWLYTWRR